MFGQDKRIEKFRDEARQAMHNGQAVHVTHIFGGPNAWGPIIDAVEREGWHLAEWTVDQSIAYPVFRVARH